MPEPYVCPYDGLPQRVQTFLHELEGLCMTHKLSLGSSVYGESLQIRDWHPDEKALYFYGIENRAADIPHQDEP